MTYEKFLYTLNINKGLEESLQSDIESFRDRYDYGDHISSVIFDILKKEAITLLLPLKDAGIGGIHFHIDEDDIVIINTNQPLCMMYFAAIHDFHHILFQSGKNSHNYDIHLNSQSYNTNEKERLASLFAASLLMPKAQMNRAYNTFRNYLKDLDEVVIRLMIKFEAPLEAVLLRLFEVGILKDTSKIKHLLGLSHVEIAKLLKKYRQSTHIMKPICIKDISPLDTYKSLIRERQSLNKNNLDLLIDDIKKQIDQVTIPMEGEEDEH